MREATLDFSWYCSCVIYRGLLCSVYSDTHLHFFVRCYYRALFFRSVFLGEQSEQKRSALSRYRVGHRGLLVYVTIGLPRRYHGQPNGGAVVLALPHRVQRHEKREYQLMRGRDLTFVALGIGVLLLVKYVVVGLVAWNLFLHPLRTDPNSAFSQPFLGLFVTKGKCNDDCA